MLVIYALFYAILCEMPLTRLDQEIVKRKLVETRELGKRLILAGKVKVNGHIVDKASEKIKPDDEIEVKEHPNMLVEADLS